ncbi:MAG: ribonuclease P protein component [Candidatus Babeliales bacterium]
MQNPGLARRISVFSKPEIQQLFKQARTCLNEQGLEVRLAPQKKEYGRILVVISRKAGNAVKRNLIRRRLKHIFYQESLFNHGLDCIVLARKEAMNLSFEQLKKLLFKAFENA